MQSFFIKLDRIAAWILLIVIIIYIVSGFGMTKGIIDPSLARNLHLSWLGVIGLIAFVIHTYWAIHLALMRHRMWNVWSKVLLMSVYIIAILSIMYVVLIYQPVAYQTSIVQNQTAKPSAVTVASVTKTFTLAELSKYNGKNGMPAYVAVSGKVYDLSSVFRNGYHQGHYAGADLTNWFNQQHYAAILDKYVIVGVLK